MGKTLFEEALADMRQLKELAESNAKQSIIDDVTPRIKQLIESQLLGESEEDNSDEEDENEEILHDEQVDEVGALGVSPPGSLGDAVEFLTGKQAAQDSGEQPEEPEITEENEDNDDGYEVDESVVKSLAALSGISNNVNENKLELNIYRLVDKVNSFLTMNENSKHSKDFIVQINNTIHDVEDMYSYLKETDNFQRKGILLNKISNCHEILNGIKETKMRMKDLLKGALREDKDVSLKISGLPDDVDLDNLSIQLVTDEAGEEAGELPAEVAPEAPEGAEGVEAAAPGVAPEEGTHMDEMGPGSGVMSMDDDDLDEDLDMSSDEDEEEDEEDLDDDDVVEVVESMLRKEIKRLKEDKEGGPRHAAGKTDPKADNFGGGKVDGEPFCDGEVTTESEDDDEEDDLDEVTSCEDEDLDEGYEDSDDDLDESEDELEELQNLRKREEKGEKVADQHVSMESRNRFAAASKKLEEARSVYAKALGTKKEVNARSLFESAKKDYRKAEVAMKAAKVAAKKLVNESTKNGNSKQPAGSKAVVESLRKQLAGTNLLNAKLIQVNKLLQIEGLTAKQKSVIIDRIDEAKDLHGVKLVYERLVKALVGKKVVKESTSAKQVIGSSSRTTKPSGVVSTSNINEGVEVGRWARLAGIN
jgi:hypothetical protein